jgi:hypothetical protein
MTVGGALRAAVRDMYEHSWRFALLNAAVSIVTVAVLVVASVTQPALLLLVAVGPMMAALVHCAVTLQQTHELALSEWFVGLRLHWRRGLVLGALSAVAVALTVMSILFYVHRAWPIAVFALYVALLFGVLQVHVWPLAVARRGDRLSDVLGDAGRAFVRRPLASVGLAFALLLVNAVGAIGILPVLTITVAYSTLAAARFALPPPTEEATT